MLYPAKLSFFKQKLRECINYIQKLLKKKNENPERRSGILEIMEITEINIAINVSSY
jgi:hypothetical protein